jgi:hypothetical protein
VVVIGLHLALLPACSWVAVTPPPQVADAPPLPIVGAAPTQVAEAEHKPCTSSVAAPVIDTVIAAALTGLAVGSSAAAASESSGGCGGSNDLCFSFDFSGAYIGAAVAAAVIATVYGFSAAYGYTKTAHCRRQRSAREAGATLKPPEETPEPVDVAVEVAPNVTSVLPVPQPAASPTPSGPGTN